jgi:hypothetical protein
MLCPIFRDYGQDKHEGQWYMQDTVYSMVHARYSVFNGTCKIQCIQWYMQDTVYSMVHAR